MAPHAQPPDMVSPIAFPRDRAASVEVAAVTFSTITPPSAPGRDRTPTASRTDLSLTPVCACSCGAVPCRRAPRRCGRVGRSARRGGYQAVEAPLDEVLIESPAVHLIHHLVEFRARDRP